MLGFELRKSLGGSETPQLVYFTIANSEAVVIGQGIKLDTDGYAVAATVGAKLMGIAAQVVDEKGIAVDPDAGTLHTYTVESDNETDKKYKVGVYVSKDLLFANDASADLAQTNVGQFFDLSDKDTINQGTASDTSGQFQLIALDPDGDGDASKGLFKIAESQLDPYALV
jgi:hypothetical protein